MAVEVLAQTIRVQPVSDVTMSTIEQDAESGNYVREFRLFGEPTTEGGPVPLILTLRAEATTRPALEVTTPTLQV